MMASVTSRRESTGCGRVAAAPVAPLGKNADFVATVDSHQVAEVPVSEQPQLSPLTANGWFLRSVGRELLQKHGYGFRLRFCGAKISRNERGVSVFRRPDRAYGRVAGVCICGQSVVCLVCAPRIAAFRSAEVADGYKRARDMGFEARLDTYTMPHWAGASLGSELDLLAKAWSRFASDRSTRSLREGYLGNHTAREITFSDVNGWHPHNHQLRYQKPGTYQEEQMRAGWLAALQTVGRLTEGAAEHAFRSEPVVDEDGARYTAKIATAVDAASLAIGMEISSSATKGRNIVRLLGDYSRGDEQAGSTWLHGVREVCTRKVSSVRWSPSLRARLGIVAPEKTDQQIAQEKAERTDELLGELTAMQWRAVLRARGEFQLCAMAQHGVDAVNNYLSRIHAGEIHTDGLPEPAGKRRA